MYKEPIDSQHDYPLNTILFHPRGSLSYVAYNFNEIVIKICHFVGIYMADIVLNVLPCKVDHSCPTDKIENLYL